MKITLYGANGIQNRPLAERLLREGHMLRVLVRNTKAARELEAFGALEVVEGDAFERADVLRAGEGAEAILFTHPSSGTPEQRLNFARDVADSAREGGARRLIFNASMRVPEAATPSRELELKRQSEAAVRGCGVSWGIVRPTVYLENLLQPQTLSGIRAGVFAHPTSPSLPLAWIAADDVAACMVAALHNEHSRAWNVGGPDALTGPQMAATLSRALAVPIAFQTIPLDAFENALNAALGAPAGTDLADFYRYNEAHPEMMASTGADGLRITPQSAFDWASKHF